MMDDTPHAHMATSAEKSGTTKWSSPECLEDHRRTVASDVYAFACVAYMVRVVTESRSSVAWLFTYALPVASGEGAIPQRAE
jgi:serine/threonine protein kinase